MKILRLIASVHAGCHSIWVRVSDLRIAGRIGRGQLGLGLWSFGLAFNFNSSLGARTLAQTLTLTSGGSSFGYSYLTIPPLLLPLKPAPFLCGARPYMDIIYGHIAINGL